MTGRIYTVAYPRSGSTWLDRLLSDLLDSPITTLATDTSLVYDFCSTGKGGCKIIKTHWRVADYDFSKKFEGAPIVFIQRDPRDVAVSALHYRKHLANTPRNLLGVIQTMAQKDSNPSFKIYHEPGIYENFVREWLEHPTAIKIKYEDLHTAPIRTLQWIIAKLDVGIMPAAAVLESYNRQRFEHWVDKHPHSMRRGVVGDWKNHFEVKHGELITECLGELMMEQEYIENLEWWKGIAK